MSAEYHTKHEALLPFYIVHYNPHDLTTVGDFCIRKLLWIIIWLQNQVGLKNDAEYSIERFQQQKQPGLTLKSLDDYFQLLQEPYTKKKLQLNDPICVA